MMILKREREENNTLNQVRDDNLTTIVKGKNKGKEGLERKRVDLHT